MKNARFIALAEQLLEQKSRQMLRSILEGKKRRRVESDVELSYDEEMLDEEDEGAGGTDAARKADDPDKAQAALASAKLDDQLHLNEEDDAQLDISNFDNEGHEELTEGDDEFSGFEMTDGEDKPVIENEEEDELGMFLEDEDELDDEDELAITEARKRKAAFQKKKANRRR